VRYTAFDIGLIVVVAIMGVLLLLGCGPASADDINDCRALASTENGFWLCMEYKQRENARSDAIWNQMYSLPMPNPLSYMPPVRQQTTCYTAGYGTVTCY